jgi:hypothetical protein
MWISPRTLPASFNDYTGTTPVAVPGTVADSANPVGLALDIRAGATVLTDPGNHMLQSTSAARPLMSARVNLLQYTEDLSGWSKDTGVAITPNYGPAPDFTSTSIRVQFDGANEQVFLTNLNGGGNPGILSLWVKGVSGETLQVAPDFAYSYPVTFTGAWQQVENYSAIANAFSLNTYVSSTARDFEVWHPQFQRGDTATPYQSVPGDGSTYTSTGITPFQKYDGVDDGMATASFAAGTLINGMDCMIAVRIDNAVSNQNIVGVYQADQSKYFGVVGTDASNTTSSLAGCGSPTYFVDGAALAGTTRGQLYAALSDGAWHIFETRGLDMAAWVNANFGNYGSGYAVNGARGDIMLFPSTASTADKDAARQYLADKYGVTLA